MINLLFLQKQKKVKDMNDFNIRIYTENKELPELLEGNFFTAKNCS